jgi:hypothetical protein
MLSGDFWRSPTMLRPIIVATLALILLPVAVFAAHQTLNICCAWNEALVDGDLTYKISGGDAAARAVVRGAVEDWDVALVLSLTEVVGKTKANITIQFKTGGGRIAGMALRHFDGEGFISSGKITISGSAFGSSNNTETVAQISRHEVGHLLGLGHSNSFGDLMDPVIGPVDQISACDVAGVFEASHWYLVDGAASLHSPHVSVISCD